jgi:hypothetical protein
MQDSKTILPKMPAEPPEEQLTESEAFTEMANRVSQHNVDQMNKLPKDYEVPY